MPAVFFAPRCALDIGVLMKLVEMIAKAVPMSYPGAEYCLVTSNIVKYCHFQFDHGSNDQISI